eukprot:366166-Chlamydomonas_euryale.AAC.6
MPAAAPSMPPRRRAPCVGAVQLLLVALTLATAVRHVLAASAVAAPAGPALRQLPDRTSDCKLTSGPVVLTPAVEHAFISLLIMARSAAILGMCQGSCLRRVEDSSLVASSHLGLRRGLSTEACLEMLSGISRVAGMHSAGAAVLKYAGQDAPAARKACIIGSNQGHGEFAEACPLQGRKCLLRV